MKSKPEAEAHQSQGASSPATIATAVLVVLAFVVIAAVVTVIVLRRRRLTRAGSSDTINNVAFDAATDETRLFNGQK